MYTQLQAALAGHPWLPNLVYLESIDSTNNYAKLLAQNGAAEGTVVLAGHQTGGRGRMGRSFSSPAGMGIYLSVILRPDCPAEELMHLTCAAGVAASDAVTDVTGQKPGIKWINDLVLSGRKLGGILTELSIDQGKVRWAVVGIGINCCQKPEDFPPEIRDIAISLGLQEEQRATVATALICRLQEMNHQLSRRSEMMERFRSRCVTLGQEISILQGHQVLHGKALAVEEDGALTVRLHDGSMRSVSSGEVSIRGMYGYV